MKLNELKQPINEAQQAEDFFRLVESSDDFDLGTMLEALDDELAGGELEKL